MVAIIAVVEGGNKVVWEILDLVPKGVTTKALIRLVGDK